MVGRSLWLVGGVLLGLAGAARSASLETLLPAPGSAEGGRAELAQLARVESRLAIYGEKLAHWRELDERTAGPALAGRRPAEWAGCYAKVENLARGYGRLQEELRSHDPAGRVPLAEGLWPVLFDDLAFLEGSCGQVYQQAAALVAAEPKAAVPAAQAVAPGPAEVGGVKAPPGELEQLEKWNRAVVLFDSGSYDEAITELGGLLNTPLAAAARDKIREAQTLVATQLRRQAAGIMARKTDDPAQKKKLLSEAWGLMNKIVTSYPEASIIDKVKQNQAQIEGQLDQLDPALLQRLKSGAPS